MATTFQNARRRRYYLAIDGLAPILWQADGTETMPGLWKDRIRLATVDGGNYFGRTIDCWDDGTNRRLVAGYQDDAGDKAKIYKWEKHGGWTLETSITPSGEGAEFAGWINGDTGRDCVSIIMTNDGDGVCAIGACKSTIDANANCGEVYVYRYSNGSWTEEQRIEPDAPAAALNFGCSVSLSSDGTTLAIGAPGDDGGFPGKGAVFMYTVSGGVWSQDQKLTASDAAAGDTFGNSVEIDQSGDLALAVGAMSRDNGGSGSVGAVYFFTYSGGSWSEDAESPLVPSSAVAFTGAGASVDIHNGWAVLGTNEEGEVYVYQNAGGTWIELQTITTGTQYFGQIAKMTDEVLIVGDPGNSTQASFAGAVYAYTRSGTTWSLAKIYYQEWKGTDDADANDHLGETVAINGDVLAGTADDDDYLGDNDCGSVYTWKLADSGPGAWTREGETCMALAKEYAVELKPSEGIADLSAMTFEVDDISE
jgi:hypothetical protein